MRVIGIYVCADMGLPMREVSEVRVIAGVGLEGDRYSVGKGFFCAFRRKVIRHVTFIASEAIREANSQADIPFLPEETRRNILTEGVDLNSLVGRTFYVDGVEMHGVELCVPCIRPSEYSDKPGFEKVFKNRGGLRAEAVSGGVVRVGSRIIPAP